MKGLEGPENRKCGKSVCFATLVKARGPNEEFRSGGLGVVLTSKKQCFSLKMLCGNFQNCASCIGGEHIFIRIIRRNGRKMKKGAERA